MKKIFTLMMVALAAMTVSAKQLYFVGNAPVGTAAGDAGWGFDADHQLPLTLASDGVTNTASLDVTGQVWFAISDGPGTSWDDFNANHRYSCSSFDNKQSGDYQFSKLGDNAVSLTTGHYEISINSETMIMTLTYTAPAAPSEDTYTVVGDGALGVEWNPASTSNVMTKKADKLFELVKENCTLQSGTNYYWRVLVNGALNGWENQYGASGYNKQVSGNDDNVISQFEDGVYTLTFTLDLSNGDASIPTVTAVKAGEAAKNILYVSDETGWTTLKVYAWGDGGEIFGGWGSTTVTGSETTVVNGVTYNKLSFLSNDATEHLIFFNGDDDQGDADPTRALVDIPANVDTYVKVTSGLAEVVDPNVYTGIEQVERTVAQPSVYYDLSGRRVSDGYRGVIISNGKKVVVK